MSPHNNGYGLSIVSESRHFKSANFSGNSQRLQHISRRHLIISFTRVVI